MGGHTKTTTPNNSEPLDVVIDELLPPAGIEPTGNRVMRPAVFTVDTFSAGQGQVTVYLDHPDGTREEVRPPHPGVLSPV